MLKRNFTIGINRAITMMKHTDQISLRLLKIWANIG